MLLFLNLFKKKKEKGQTPKAKSTSQKRRRTSEQVASRKGELVDF